MLSNSLQYLPILETSKENGTKHVPQKVTESNDGKTIILYDHPIRTDRTMSAQNVDSNFVKKEAEKRLKYQGLKSEECGRQK